MLKEEEIKEVIGSYEKKLEAIGVKEGLIYNANLEINNQRGNVSNVAFGFSKFKYAKYPHIVCTLINDNLEEIMSVSFVNADEFGDPVSKFNAKELANEQIFDINELEDFAKTIKVGKLKKELYLGEIEKLKKQIESLEKLIEENGIKED